ncbi:hypothetical protein HDU97_005533 [Phlyctochytrium planicorne]|nr:hypothetical protein HDU97_005533 [Phlyctochytrium planicorne]
MVDASVKETGAAPVIIPPPEIKAVAEKTAAYVAKNGVNFEERIREDKKHDQKFCFLNPNDPYRPYYDLKVKEAKEGTGQQKKEEGDKVVFLFDTQAERKDCSDHLMQALSQEKASAPQSNQKLAPKEPPPDVVRLTALFVARNGLQFQTSLAQREQRNFQFDFLRPNHSLYSYYRSLVAQYVRVLQPPKPSMAKLKEAADNKFTVLERISSRIEYEEYLAEEKKKAAEEADQEKIAYALIDWHDFVVVETVEFVDADDILQLPPPISIMDLEGLTLTQKRNKSLFATDTSRLNATASQDADMDMDEGDDDAPASKPVSKAPPPGLLSTPRPMMPGITPRPPVPIPGMPSAVRLPPKFPGMPSLPQKPGARPIEDDAEENDPKRQKLSDELEASLISEKDFLTENPDNIRLNIQHESGTTDIGDLPMVLTIQQLKDKIAAKITSMPSNRQKLALSPASSLQFQKDDSKPGYAPIPDEKDAAGGTYSNVKTASLTVDAEMGYPIFSEQLKNDWLLSRLFDYDNDGYITASDLSVIVQQVLRPQFAPGDRVRVRNDDRIGVVRYFGETSFSQGVWVGLELDDAGLELIHVGKHDGMVQGVRYFSCEAGKGVFVPFHMLDHHKLATDIIDLFTSGIRDKVSMEEFMECLKLLHELGVMSQRLDIPFLQHFFKTFDPDTDKNLASTISHFHLRENLETTDYRSAYHQLCDWFYGWNVTDGTDFTVEDSEATEHFRMKRVPRDIDMSEKGERLEGDRIMKTYETLFTISRRALKRIYLEIEEELPRIGTGIGTMLTQGREEEEDMGSKDIDKEDLWRQRADVEPTSSQRDDELEDELEDEDDLAHFAAYERRVSRVSDGMTVRRKSSAPVAVSAASKNAAIRVDVPDEIQEGDEEAEEDGEMLAASSNDGLVENSKGDAKDELPPRKSPSKSSKSSSPHSDEKRDELGDMKSEASAAPTAQIESGFTSRRQSMAPGQGPFQFSMVKPAVGLLRHAADSEESRKVVQHDINHIYSQTDRSVDYTLVCISNILLILGFAEMLDEKAYFDKFYGLAHDISTDFVSNTLKTVWDLLNRELPGKMDLKNLRNPDLLKQRFKEIVDLRGTAMKGPKNKIRKLYRKFILLHELLKALDIHLFPNFVAAHKDGIKCAQFSLFDSSLWLTGGYDCVLRIHDIRASNSHICLAQYVGHKSIVTDAHFAKDDTIIVSCSFDRTVKIWNAQSAACERTLVGHSDSVTTCHVTADARYIASGSTDNTIRLWDFNSGDCLCTIKRHSRWLKKVRFSPDGRYLITAGLDNKIYTWDVKFLISTKSASHTRCIESHSDYILDIATYKSNLVLSSSRDSTVRLHDFLTGQELVCVNLAPSWACAVAFSADGVYFVTGSFDNNINIFTTAEGERVREIRSLNLGIMSVGFPRDLEYVVVGTVEGFLQQIFL